MIHSVTATAPATVANLGAGFDVLGLALAGEGDTVTARRVPGASGVRIEAITGDDGRLPTEAAANTAGVAAIETLKRAGFPDVGIALTLKKGLPLCSGLGSSAASAAAAAFAVNQLLGGPLRKLELVEPCVAAEAVVSGRHADNVAPALLGGLVLVRSLEPLDLVRLPIPEGLTLAVVTPGFDLPTAKARAALPDTVSLRTMVGATAQIAALVSAFWSGDLSLLSRGLTDSVVTPARAALIPGAEAAMAAALDVGALGSGISGAGPSLFALCRSERAARAAMAEMADAFADAGLPAIGRISPADCPGVRLI